MQLQTEQEELLCRLVEAERNTDREGRQEFLGQRDVESPNTFISHPGLGKERIEVIPEDIDVLVRYGYLSVTKDYGANGLTFYIGPPGFQLYREISSRRGELPQHVEEEVRNYLDRELLQSRYPAALVKLAQAQALLWDADAAGQITAIGLRCREAMMEFVSTLIETYRPPDVSPDKAHTVSRLKSVFAVAGPKSETVSDHLDALITYWGTTTDLAQRQTHGLERSKEILVLEDARRAVFHTMLVMYEVDRSLRTK